MYKLLPFTRSIVGGVVRKQLLLTITNTTTNSNVTASAVMPTLNNCFLHSSTTMMDKFEIKTEQEFKDKVLEKSKKNLVLVDFYATWCGPCKQLTPLLETVLDKHTGVDLAKIDVDELDSLAGEYGVESIPRVFALKNGQIVDKFVGLKDEQQLNTFITEALKK